MSSRDVVLARVRRALADVPRGEGPDDPPVVRDYHRVHGSRTAAQDADLLAENLADYRALVHRSTAEELPSLIRRLLAERGARRVLVPPGLDASWTAWLPGSPSSGTAHRARPGNSMPWTVC